jgi:DNA polymerase IV
MSKERRIIHIDMDAFFAAVEQRDNPDLMGRPVIVGGSPDSRGVVATASYEARAYGVRSAMSSARAKQLCPQAIFLRPRFRVYQRISRLINGIFHDFTDIVEPIALDEAYLDVTQNKRGVRFASVIARQIQCRIQDYTGLSASAGVGPNKFIAKAASGFRKPAGLTVVRPERVFHFLDQLKLDDIPGIGKVTLSQMHKRGIFTIDQLRSKTLAELGALFGNRASWFYELSRGVDEREVCSERERKSLGVEHTYESDLLNVDAAAAKVRILAQELALRATQRDIRGHTLVLKIKFSDFSIVTRQTTLRWGTQNENQLIVDLITFTAIDLLSQCNATWRPVRLLGLSLKDLTIGTRDDTPCQLTLF